MRIKVAYSTTYDYAKLASDVVQLLRVEPCGHHDQHIVQWRLDTDTDGHLRRGTDVFGNITHMFYADAPIRRLALHVTGEVDTNETHGVLRGTAEPLPSSVFLRTTPLSTADDAIRNFARASTGADPLETCHNLLTGLYDRMTFDADVTHSHTDAIHAFALQAGVCQDYSHIFVAAARHLGIPARYVSGHLVRADGLVTQPAGHAWVETHLPDLGWVGFDPTNGMSTTDAYLRVAIGLDYLDAAPVRGARRGGGAETMVVSVTASDGRLAPVGSDGRLAPAPSQSQSQSQA
nr:transglutaminase family protein [Polymorphobacter sp.]